jgi:hypothetical protein
MTGAAYCAAVQPPIGQRCQDLAMRNAGAGQRGADVGRQPLRQDDRLGFRRHDPALGAQEPGAALPGSDQACVEPVVLGRGQLAVSAAMGNGCSGRGAAAFSPCQPAVSGQARPARGDRPPILLFAKAFP